jgi:competence transcription factor ComK
MILIETKDARDKTVYINPQHIKTVVPSGELCSIVFINESVMTIKSNISSLLKQIMYA